MNQGAHGASRQGTHADGVRSPPFSEITHYAFTRSDFGS